MVDELVPVVIPDNMAKLNITYSGMQGDYPDLISVDLADEEIKRIAVESVRGGYVPGITANETVDFSEFVVDRFAPHPEVPYSRVSLRPKTAFGVTIDT